MSITIKSNPDGVSGAIQVNGVDAVTVDKTGIIQGAPFSFRNKIINGDMRIDQRNSGAAVTPSGIGAIYTLDRFYLFATAASKFTVQQVDSPAGFYGFAKSAKLTVASAYTPVAGEVFALDQAIEGHNFASLGWGTSAAQAVTVSFTAQASISGTYNLVLLNAAGNRSYCATYYLTANTPTRCSVTIPGDTSGTWATGNTTGCYLIFGLGAGASMTTSSPNSWLSGNYNASTGSVQLVQTAGATFYITGVQLEAGTVATPFEHRPYGTELALCQRYYEVCGFIATASTPPYTTIRYAVVKRAVPTLAVTFGSISPATLNSRGADYFSMDGTAASNVAAVATASAEL